MFKRFRNIDVVLYLFPLLLWGISCAVLWSLTYASSDPAVANLAIKQVIFGVIGIVVMLFLTVFDYRNIRGIAWIVGVITLLLLLAVEFFGSTSLGATRWLDFKVFQLQPSEMAKIALILVLGTYLALYVEKVTARVFGIVAIVLFPALILVLKQPDLGTAIVLTAISLGMLFAIHLQAKHIIGIVSVAVLLIGIGWLSVQNIKPFGRLLRDYQRSRIEVFLNPEADPLNKGYNVRQAVIALGNGGVTGRGLGKEVGQLSQLNFLPKTYTDFIFAALGESMGFIGAGLVLILFAGLLWRILLAASVARDDFGALICYGFLSMIAVSVLINVGMNLGIMPVTGIPLPFVSAGGTALIMDFVGIGLVQSIILRRQVIKFD